jgi:hypothetical protein
MQMRRVWEKVPFTRAHSESRIAERARQEVLLEQTKEGLRARGSGTAAKDPALEGTITEFKSHFVNAIRYGYMRDASVDTGDMDIRRAVREQDFINKVALSAADSQFATPIEAEDAKYAEQSKERRVALARKLASGSLGSITTDELDLMLSTILASSADGNPLMPKAYKAFFDFLEIAAHSSAPGREGAFIANVLLSLASSNTVNEELKVNTQSYLADVILIENTLGRKADPLLEKAVVMFRDMLNTELTTPTNEMVGELDAPGLGCGGRRGIIDAVTNHVAASAAVKSAKAAHEEAEAKHNEAWDAYNAASNACDAAVTAHSTAVAARQKNNTAANIEATTTTSQAATNAQTVLRAAESVFVAAEATLQNAAGTLQAAEARRQAAQQAILSLVPEVAGMDGENAGLAVRRLFRQEQEFLHASKAFQDAFRSAFMDSCRSGKRLDAKTADKPDEATGLDQLGDTGHPLVMAFAIQARAVSAFIAEHGHDKAWNKLSALDTSVSGMRLPRSLIREMDDVVERMRNTSSGNGYEKEAVEKSIATIEKRYCYPVKKAAVWAIDNYPRSRLGQVSDFQWIAARLIFQHESRLKSSPFKPDKFRGLRNDWHLMMHRQLPATWYLKVPILAVGFAGFYYPGKWFAKATFLNRNFKKGIRGQGSMYTDKYDRKHQSWWKKGYTGILQATGAATVATLLISSLVSSMNFSARYQDSAWKGAKAWYWRLPPSQLAATPGKMLFRWPWQWPTIVPGRYDTLKTYDDDLNIPERLPGRPDSYFRSAFGVGNDSAGAKKRLDWLRNHKGVLQFFQERVSGMHVNEVHYLAKNPANTLKSDTTTVNGHVVTTRVWRTVRLDTQPITDGLVLNRDIADEFVDTLMAREAQAAVGHPLGIGAKTLDYAYMAANRLAWEGDGFLIGQKKQELMKQFRVMDDDNGVFILLQSGAKDLLEPRAHLGVSTKYITRPDMFVDGWRKNLRALTGVDPTQVPVSPEALRQAFDSTSAQLMGSAIRDATPEFEAAGIAARYGADDSTRSLLGKNDDIRSLLLQFGGTSGYYLNQNRIDDFVQYLASWKQAGKKISDFNPFAQGAQAGWASTEGYFSTSPFPAQGATDTSNAAAAPPQAGAGTLSPEAKAFYSGPGGAQLDAVLDGMKADDSTRQNVYDMLTDTSIRAKGRRALASLDVSGSGTTMKVTVGNKKMAKKWLSSYARQ